MNKKQSLIVFGLAGILFLAAATQAFAAPAKQSAYPTGSANVQIVTLTPQATPSAVQSTPAQGATQAWGRMGRGGMQGQGRMGMHDEMGGMHNATVMMMPYGTSPMTYQAMGTGVTSMREDVAGMLAMTTDDLHQQMAAGKSLVQIAAEKGITEQQLMDGMIAGRRAAFAQAVKAGQMTQAQADGMLLDLQHDLSMMVNGQGVASGSWGSMMWGGETDR